MKTRFRAGLCAIALLSVFSTLTAQQQGFTYDCLLEHHDKDQDGVITADEFTGKPQLFSRMDHDNDGSINCDEFNTAMKARKNRSGSRFEEGRNRYASQGLQAGQTIPNLTVYDLNGNTVTLSSLWKDQPALLVTASATCPISVKSCPSLKPLSIAHSNEVNIAILYVKEAHPAEDGANTPNRTLGSRTHSQPKTFNEKLKLARLFDREINHGNTLYTDDLERTAANALGAGPNIGLLINTDGRIILRQGWYDAKEMEAAIHTLHNNASKPRRPSRSRQLPENITIHQDLEYAVADGESLKLDIYLPKDTKTAPPLMVWIHGGGWKNGDKANVNSAILRLSGEGYAVASINYRLKDLSIHPRNIHDCKGAIRWLRNHASEYGFDPSRVAVGGGSAGGHLALLLGLSEGIEKLEGTVGGNTHQSSGVKAIVDLYGPSELTIMLEKSERFARSHSFIMEQLADASPLTYLTPGDPPVLILHGDNDKTVPVEQSHLLHKRYQNADLESELHIFEGVGHGGMVFSNENSYQLIKMFLDQHLAE